MEKSGRLVQLYSENEERLNHVYLKMGGIENVRLGISSNVFIFGANIKESFD